MKLKQIRSWPYGKYVVVFLIFMLSLLLQQLGIIPGSTIIVLGSVIFYSVVGVGMNILLGCSGLITLGGAGFMGLAAYLSAYCTGDLGLPFLLSLLVSTGIPLIVGLAIGLVSLRLEGYYLAIATLGIAEILKQLFMEMEFFTGGFSGKRAGHPVLFGIELTREATFVFYAFILLVVLVLAHNLVNSATGRAFLTMRGSESAAQAMGISLLRYKLIAFAVSTVFTAVGGVMYVHFIRYAYPTVWGLGMSLNFLSIVVVGGLGTIMGSVVGSFVIIGVPELILKQLPIIGSMSGIPYIFNGVMIILVMLFYSNGLVHVGKDIKRLLMKLRKKGGKTDDA